MFYSCSCNINNQFKSKKNHISSYSRDSIRVGEYSYQIDSNKVIYCSNNYVSLLNEFKKLKYSSAESFSSCPKMIKDFLNTNCYNSFRIADIGENWRETDVVENDLNLPTRQLKFLKMNERFVFITFNTGGFGSSYNVMIFKHDGNKIIEFWHGTLMNGGKIENFNELLDCLERNNQRIELGGNFMY